MQENDSNTPDLFDGLDPAPGGGATPPPGAPIAALPGDGDALPLGAYAERAYLEYAVSVVKGRALPDVRDGQKPVQRRILYAMREMGLAATAKPVKSARVVGDVLGKYHPHGDQSAYDAMVRLAQNFSLRYPLVDGHGNFGSRDGDGAAAMRYTEARLTPIADLLLSEIDMGTVDFGPNYDGAFKEPRVLPARLPMLLLNGASGIAVGMATEIPAHNLREVAQAAVTLIRNPRAGLDDILEHIQGPDFPGGGQIISSRADIRAAYETGRGSLKVRARWVVEDLARGQWQVAVTELPPGTSSQRVLEEIEELTNPKVKAGKKALSQDQTQLKQLMLSVLESVRDESGKDNAVRLVFEPRSSRQDVGDFMTKLLAHTSMESSVSINMVMIGADGRPRQKSLPEVLSEWIAFRFDTVRRRTRHRLGQVDERIHVLEGRMLVLLNIDEVIRIIRNADEPKAELMARFNLTERQADDILDIRLRQLARLEAIRIEQELAQLRVEKSDLENLLADDSAMKRLLTKEVSADARAHGDDRRTLIEASERAVVEVTVVDEPVTVILSVKGWIRTRNGHGLDTAGLTFKEGDALAAALECRSVDLACFLDSTGRAFSVAVSALPGGRGDGVPLPTLIELAPGVRVQQMACGAASQRLLLATSGGYGFNCTLGDLQSRVKAGKQFMTLEPGEDILRPVPYTEAEDLRIGALSADGRVLVFPLAEMKSLSGGGRGVIVMGLDDKEKLLAVEVFAQGLVVLGTGRGGKDVRCEISGATLAEFDSRRARKGRLPPQKMKATGLEALVPPAPVLS